MSDDIEFIDGMSVKDRHQNAPDFILCVGGFRRQAMIEYLQQQEGDYVNFQIKRSKSGKLYVQRDTWKPGNAQRPDTSPAQPSPPSAGGGFEDSDVPFAPYQKGWIA